ncbi:MAG: insulinase family protein [Lachnospiraceae bacterium]
MNLKELTSYEMIEERDVKDIQSKGYLLKHKKSGARILLMSNEDDNKVFTIGFRTPPSDSTGVAHILEHSVLCGSKNFPVKDPFVELVKGSLNTFLNAMTYPDKTVYPVASRNAKDFQNLMHVYMDAVFYPNIYEYEEIFRQEGWSYKLDDTDGKLEYNGVVYNEMKGAFSSPEGVLDRAVLNSLFPDTSYANESGGDPEAIPDLTYEQFLDFHKKYYHPSNSYIYLYGDMDMAEKLHWLDQEYLSNYDVLEVDSKIQLQKAFHERKEVEIEYSITSNEEEQDNTFLSYNKVIGTSLDKELCMAFEVLDYALLSAPGAPLKKALIDAGIGKDIMGSYDDGVYQPIFSIVAKNANKDQKEAFIQVIEDTLKDIVTNGMNQKSIEAGINYHEFRFREADFGNYPKGLMYGLQMFDSWLYDENKPFLHVEALETFEFLKKNKTTGYFEELIQTYLLNNSHESIVTVIPQKGQTAKLEKKLEAKLEAFKKNLTKSEVEHLVRCTQDLLNYQEEPSDKVALETIPLLKIEDIDPNIEPIVNQVVHIEDITMVYHELETNGIGYMDLLFDLGNVSTKLLPYVGILQSVLGVIDTEHYEYGALFNEINVHTGGIMTSLETYPDVTRIQDNVFKSTFEIKTKALYLKLPFAFEMMEEILLHSKLEDEKRLLEILSMLKSRMQMRFQSSGHTTAVMRAKSYTSPMAGYREITNGIEFYEVVRNLEEHFEENKEVLIQNLKTLIQTIFRPENLIVSYTAAKEGLEEVKSRMLEFRNHLCTTPITAAPYQIECKKKNEGFKTSSKVQYVARTGNFINAGCEYTGALQILKVILSYDYLWQNVRVKGGAYGCMSGFNRIGESFFVSYRDPNLKKTNEIYKGIVDYLKQFQVGERDMTKYIIGTISNMDQPMNPASKGDRSMNLYLNHVSREMIEEERRQILNATEDDIRKLAQVVEAVLADGSICVIGSEEKIETDKHLFKEVKDLL